MLDPPSRIRLSGVPAADPTLPEDLRLQTRINDLGEQKEKLLDLYLSNALGKKTFQEKCLVIDIELAEVRELMTSHPETERAIIKKLPVTDAAFDRDWATRGIEWQRLVTECVIKRVTVQRGRKPRIADRLVYDLW